ncbi:MAG TPA: ABC transporter permease [Thermoanaerobaculia bacterium]|jgi:putative ABC transport system permease protein|nr:ABC transporter permease [Thermoanaerobaculia bacterium]
MATLWQDLRFGVRALLRNPLPTGLALLVLTLGIGANTAIFSVISGVLLEPLPYPSPERLILAIDSAPRLGFPLFASSPLNYRDWCEQNRSFSTLDAFNIGRFNLTAAARPVAVRGGAVTAHFFRTLGVEPLLGRFFRAEDDRPGAEPVTVVSYDLWHTAFGADPGLVGRRIQIDGRYRTVVGIAPRGLAFPRQAAVWLPLALDYANEGRGGHYLRVLGRLRPGVTLPQAQADMSAIAARLERLYPETNSAWGIVLEPLRERLVADVKPALVLLERAVWAVLLIACANVANLLLARMSSRGPELAVRAALGAGRYRLVRQVVAESVVLFGIGGALGLVAAWFGTRVLLAISPDAIPRSENVGLDGRVLLYTLAVSLGCGVLVGLVPALAAAGGSLHAPLKEGGWTKAGGHSGRWLRHPQKVLVMSEVALALALLIASGLLLRSFARLQSVRPGFEPRGVMTATLSLPDVKYPDEARQAQFCEQLLQRVSALPGVENAAAVYPLPLAGDGYGLRFTVAGRPQPAPAEMPRADVVSITPDYFRAMTIPLLAGRYFTAQDRIGAQPVIIVNRAMARRLWPGESPLGKRLTFDPPTDPKARWLTVVGMVGDVRAAALRTEPGSQAYWPELQRPMSEMALVLRTSRPPALVVPPLRQLVQALDPDLPLYRVQTLATVVAASLDQNRVKTLLIGCFGALALLLAAVGIYGLVSYSVAQRTHEIGIRVALGAGRREVLRMVIVQGMGLVAAGLAVGLAVAWACSRLLADQLYEIKVTDPLTYAGVPLLLAAVALAANWLPARRATRVDPLEALRAE